MIGSRSATSANRSRQSRLPSRLIRLARTSRMAASAEGSAGTRRMSTTGDQKQGGFRKLRPQGVEQSTEILLESPQCVEILHIVRAGCDHHKRPAVLLKIGHGKIAYLTGRGGIEPRRSPDDRAAASLTDDLCQIAGKPVACAGRADRRRRGIADNQQTQRFAIAFEAADCRIGGRQNPLGPQSDGYTLPGIYRKRQPAEKAKQSRHETIPLNPIDGRTRRK